MLEKNKALLDTVPSVSPSQSPLPIYGKMLRKAAVRGDERQQEDEELIFWNCHRWIDCTSNNGREDWPFTCRHSLFQSFDIAAPNARGRKLRFHRGLSAETTMIKGSFGGTASSSIVLEVFVDKKKHSYGQLHCFTLSQSLLPIDGK